ncbi:MAG: hypothetical protein ABIH37_04660 [archaeon]
MDDEDTGTLAGVVEGECRLCGGGNVEFNDLAVRLKLSCGDCGYEFDDSGTEDKYWNYEDVCPRCEKETIVQGDKTGFDRTCTSCSYTYDLPDRVI